MLGDRAYSRASRVLKMKQKKRKMYTLVQLRRPDDYVDECELCHSDDVSRTNQNTTVCAPLTDDVTGGNERITACDALNDVTSRNDETTAASDMNDNNDSLLCSNDGSTTCIVTQMNDLTISDELIRGNGPVTDARDAAQDVPGFNDLTRSNNTIGSLGALIEETTSDFDIDSNNIDSICSNDGSNTSTQISDLIRSNETIRDTGAVTNARDVTGFRDLTRSDDIIRGRAHEIYARRDDVTRFNDHTRSDDIVVVSLIDEEAIQTIETALGVIFLGSPYHEEEAAAWEQIFGPAQPRRDWRYILHE